MKQFLYVMIGYSDICIPIEAIKDIWNFANEAGILLLKMRIKESGAIVRVYLRDENKICAYLQNCGVVCSVLMRRGLPVLWRQYRHRVGLLVGMALLFFVLIIAPMFVWEINVTGNDRLSYEYVTELLREEGVYVGAFSPSIDRDAVYRNILHTEEDISWLSVNIRGSSVNVEILEREYAEADLHMADGANIVASKEGVITDIKTMNGRAAVQKGDAVQQGTLLVSGVYDTERMGTRYVYANAEVYAIVYDEYCVEIPLNNTHRVYSDETVLEVSIKMFEKSINIFKNYSILDENYGTISREDALPFFLLKELPLSLETVCALPYDDVAIVLTEAEALARAKQELWRQIETEAEYVDMLALEESYTVENAVLIYHCSVEAIENIAAVSEFNME